MTEERIYDIAPELIEDSPTNPRQHYPKESIDELAESIRDVGIIEPLIVRIKGTDIEGPYECIVGHRRKRGAIRAGLLTVPCLIREMTDEQVREMQHIENLHREDVHPMEEALSFEAMLEMHGADQLAAKVGKSVQYIHSRLRLLELTNQNRELFMNGRFELGHALIIARLRDEKDQDEGGRFAAYGYNGVAKTIAQCEKIEKEDDEPFEPSSLSATRNHVERLMRSINDVPWDPADAELLPKAGPCTTCPKMTGNEAQEALFVNDVQATGRCTDRSCYDAKMDATWKRLTAEHKKIGGTVLTKKAAKATFGSGSSIVYESEYDDLMRSSWSHDGKSLFQLLEPDPKDIILARDGHGTIRYLYPSKKAKALLRKKLSKSGDGTLTPKEKGDRLKRRRENEVNKTMQGVMEIATRIILGDPTFQEHVDKQPTDDEGPFLIAIALMLLDADFDGRIAKSLDYAQDDYEQMRDEEHVIGAMRKDMQEGKLKPLDVILRYAVRRYRGFTILPPAFEWVCEELNVPIHELVDKNLAELKAKWDEQDERRKKKGKKNGKKSSAKKNGKSSTKSKSKAKKDEPPSTDPDPAPGPEAA